MNSRMLGADFWGSKGKPEGHHPSLGGSISYFETKPDFQQEPMEPEENGLRLNKVVQTKHGLPEGVQEGVSGTSILGVSIRVGVRSPAFGAASGVSGGRFTRDLPMEIHSSTASVDPNQAAESFGFARICTALLRWPWKFSGQCSRPIPPSVSAPTWPIPLTWRYEVKERNAKPLPGFGRGWEGVRGLSLGLAGR